MAIWSVGEVKRLDGSLSKAVGAPVGNRLRRPRAHCAAIVISERGHPDQLVRKRVDIERIESTSGRAVGLWYECGCAACARRNQEREAARGSLINDEAPRLGKTRKYEGTGVSIPTWQRIGLKKARTVDCVCAVALRDRLLELGRKRTIAADHQVPGGDGVALRAIACERLDQADQVLFRNEPADREKIRSRR